MYVTYFTMYIRFSLAYFIMSHDLYKNLDFNMIFKSLHPNTNNFCNYYMKLILDQLNVASHKIMYRHIVYVDYHMYIWTISFKCNCNSKLQ